MSVGSGGTNREGRSLGREPLSPWLGSWVWLAGRGGRPDVSGLLEYLSRMSVDHLFLGCNLGVTSVAVAGFYSLKQVTLRGRGFRQHRNTRRRGHWESFRRGPP